MLRPVTLAAVSLLAALVLACSGDDTPAATATPSPAATAAPTRPPATATVTSPPATATTAVATPLPTFPPVEGTIDPLGFGGTEPIDVKSNPDPLTSAALLRAVRVGAHPELGGWDRIVFEFADVLPPANIRYAANVAQCGSGMPVQLPGTAVLLVTMQTTNAHTEAGQPTVANRQIEGPGNAILQSRQICDFEAVVQWAIGVDGMQRFKVTRLESPTRIVIDIKW
jgi:hypothetical protein